MPSSMPYDPSLVLAQIVDEKKLDNVTQIAEQQALVDGCQEKLNSLLASKRSLDMTRMELANLGINTDKISEEIEKMNAVVQDSAVKYAQQRIKSEKAISGLRGRISQVNSSVESPVDFVKSEIKTMPLASDSVSMDVQYFSYEVNKQNSAAYAKTIGTYVSAQTSWLGVKASAEAGSSASKKSAEQVSQHDIAGTLVLSVNCSHKNASILAPCIINPDKAVKAWNRTFPGDPIHPTNRGEMAKIAQDIQTKDKKKLSIISGTTFGSSFVGMVHVLNNSKTSASQSLESLATNLQATMDGGSWLEGASGGFGVNTSIANEVKNLLSTQNITSHVTMICMGVIPSMVANDVKMGVQQFAKFDPESSMEAVTAIRNDTVADQNTVMQSAEAARTGQKMIAMKSGDIKATMAALSEIDSGANKILDINSMMTALDDYIKKAAEGNCGIPLNYYLKDISKGTICELWVAKYYPGEYMQIREDDSENVQAPTK